MTPAGLWVAHPHHGVTVTGAWDPEGSAFEAAAESGLACAVHQCPTPFLLGRKRGLAGSSHSLQVWRLLSGARVLTLWVLPFLSLQPLDAIPGPLVPSPPLTLRGSQVNSAPA